MRIKNGEAEKFALFLLSLKLKGQQNRIRNRMVKMIQNHLKEVQEEHKQLLDDYGKKDEQGNLKIIKNENNSYYDIDDVAGFQKEFDLLMNEELVIENNEQFKDMNKVIQEIILNVDKEFSGQEALEYERFCEIVEDIIITTS